MVKIKIRRADGVIQRYHVKNRKAYSYDKKTRIWSKGVTRLIRPRVPYVPPATWVTIHYRAHETRGHDHLRRDFTCDCTYTYQGNIRDEPDIMRHTEILKEAVADKFGQHIADSDYSVIGVTSVPLSERTKAEIVHRYRRGDAGRPWKVIT